MATAKEIGLRPGDMALYASAELKLDRGMISGIPLDTPGARISWGVIQVIEIETPATLGLGNSTKGILLDTNDPYERDIIGQKREIWHGFCNFISEGDERLLAELRSAGWRMTMTISPEGTPKLALVPVADIQEESDI